MTPIIVGENVIVRRSIVDSGGSAVALSSLASINAELYDEDKNIIQTYTYPSASFRLGSVSNMLELEITGSVSLKLPKGIVYIKYILEKTDAIYSVDGKLIDKISEAILEVSE